jgi:hypothetical protein
MEMLTGKKAIKVRTGDFGGQLGTPDVGTM